MQVSRVAPSPAVVGSPPRLGCNFVVNRQGRDAGRVTASPRDARRPCPDVPDLSELAFGLSKGATHPVRVIIVAPWACSQ